MKTEIYKFDIITKMFSAGAQADVHGGAEIRVPEIRAQLRWWFRLLGGFKNDTRPVREQETNYFGGVGTKSLKSKIGIRVKVSPTLKQEFKDADALGAGLNTPLGYILFPLRSNEKKGVDASRAHFLPNENGSYAFEVSLAMNGSESDLNNVRALMTVFGNLGSLGFRSRRCMGALAFHGKAPMSLSDALGVFKCLENVSIKELQAGGGSADACVTVLANWLKDWRSYGSNRFGLKESASGFKYAKKDHDVGVGEGDVAYRAAIGLPIIQQYSSGEKIKNEWEADNAERFASPVILRPHRGIDGKYIPLVIFVDLYKWPDGRNVTLLRRNNQTKKRELYRVVEGADELYEGMKKDSRLRPFSVQEL